MNKLVIVHKKMQQNTTLRVLSEIPTATIHPNATKRFRKEPVERSRVACSAKMYSI